MHSFYWIKGTVQKPLCLFNFQQIKSMNPKTVLSSSMLFYPTTGTFREKHKVQRRLCEEIWVGVFYVECFPQQRNAYFSFGLNTIHLNIKVYEYSSFVWIPKFSRPKRKTFENNRFRTKSFKRKTFEFRVETNYS